MYHEIYHASIFAMFMQIRIIIISSSQNVIFLITVATRLVNL